MSFLKSRILYYRLAQLTPIAVYILMMLGSYVKAIGARIACPDWPLCYGKALPWEFDATGTGFSIDQIMAEYIHRLFALVVVVFILGILVLSYYHRTDRNSDNEPIGMKRFQLMILVTVLLAIQVIFGALTVLVPENLVVSLHLAVATLIFGGTIFHVSWIKI